MSTFFYKGKCASAIYEYPFWVSCLRCDSGKSETIVDGTGLREYPGQRVILVVSLRELREKNLRFRSTRRGVHLELFPPCRDQRL